jgi:hypothetical protein
MLKHDKTDVIGRTEANFWLRTLKTTPIEVHLSDFDFE